MASFNFWFGEPVPFDGEGRANSPAEGKKYARQGRKSLYWLWAIFILSLITLGVCLSNNWSLFGLLPTK